MLEGQLNLIGTPIGECRIRVDPTRPTLMSNHLKLNFRVISSLKKYWIVKYNNWGLIQAKLFKLEFEFESNELSSR